MQANNIKLNKSLIGMSIQFKTPEYYNGRTTNARLIGLDSQYFTVKINRGNKNFIKPIRIDSSNILKVHEW